MKIGIALGRAGAHFSSHLALARSAEQHGFDYVTTGDNGAETFALSGAIAAVTTQLGIVSSIAAWTRTPATMAHSAATVANLSDGRFQLGIGPAPRQWIREWHGMEFDPVLPRMREYVLALRACLDATPAEPTDLKGTYYSTHGYDGWDMALPSRVPVHLGVTQPAMTRLSAEVADGAQINSIHPLGWLETVGPQYLREGLERGGRMPDHPFSVGVGRFVGVHEDRAVAYDLCRAQIAFYLAIPYFRPLVEPFGFGPELDAGEAALRAGDPAGAVAAISDRMVAAIGIAGTPAEVVDQLQQYAGVVDYLTLGGGMDLDPDVAQRHIELMLTVFGRD